MRERDYRGLRRQALQGIGDMFRASRVAQHLSQERVAMEAGLTTYTYRCLERGAAPDGSDANPTVVAPGNIGLYGDFNDLSDPCTVSSITVGAAQPQAIPTTAMSTNELMITMYPAGGMDTSSVVGSIVQPVSRQYCEENPSMYLMDCMGVYPGAYPGPGTTENRMVLNNEDGWFAPELCWYSGNFGHDLAQWWNCNSGS